MAEELGWKSLSDRLQRALDGGTAQEIRAALEGASATTIALAMDRLAPENIAMVFAQLDHSCRADVLAKLSPEEAAEAIGTLSKTDFQALVGHLPPRDAAEAVAAAPAALRKQFLADNSTSGIVAADIRNRLSYPEGSAGRLMTNDFVRLPPDISVEQALNLVRSTDASHDLPNNAYIVEPIGDGEHERLLGAISIRQLVMAAPDQKVEDLMATDVVSIKPRKDDDEAASLLSKLKFLALPVVDEDNLLLGVIPADDLMEVVVARLRRRYAQSVGTDAEAMEHTTPLGAAKLRTPWLIGTMFLELGAGLVIAHYNHILEHVILLASFMPVISAVSGNVGLQAAAIVVRGLDIGQVSLRKSGTALLKESTTAILMALVCGLILGTIGIVWSKHLALGLVIGGAMACSMLTAGIMGTLIPTISKRLGFDPATTAGPFETAFQDIIGFGVFLGLATWAAPWIS